MKHKDYKVAILNTIHHFQHSSRLRPLNSNFSFVLLSLLWDQRSSTSTWTQSRYTVHDVVHTRHGVRVDDLRMRQGFLNFFLRGSGCCGKIKRLGRQHSEIGQQASSDKTCLEQTKARLRCVRTGPEHFEDVRRVLEASGAKSEEIRCPSRNQSLGGGGGGELAPAILRLITQ